MNTDKYIYLIITAGRGPAECALAVQGIQNKFQKYLKQKGIDFELSQKKKGPVKHSLHTITFKLSSDAMDHLDRWVGNLLWICKSPIRPTHKRKNWFVKSMIFHPTTTEQLNKADVIVQSYRASGPGGQHRNKVETAVRLVDTRTGLSVTESDGKSQHQNKKAAWKKLEELIALRNIEQLEALENKQWISQCSIERGNPIRIFKGIKFNTTF